MVVSLLNSPAAPGAQRPTAADHHFAYPKVQPVQRPAAARVDDPRQW
jgi:hypothetical protein